MAENPSYCPGCEQRGAELGERNARVIELEAEIARLERLLAEARRAA